MDSIQIVVLAMIQGLTEFLPVSSSAHLILLPAVTGWQDQGVVMDVAAHVGTLTAVLAYFRADLTVIVRDWCGSLFGGPKTVDSRLGWAVILGTIPLVIAGLLLHDLASTVLRSPLVIATATIVFGLLLWWADARGSKLINENAITVKDALLIGVYQALALIPGTSRSGITMTAGLILGLTRQAAARFSFLLSIPAILAAGGMATLKLITGSAPVDWVSLIMVLALSAISAYLCIHVFLKLLDRTGMLPYVLYRLVLGAVLFWLFL